MVFPRILHVCYIFMMIILVTIYRQCNLCRQIELLWHHVYLSCHIYRQVLSFNGCIESIILGPKLINREQFGPKFSDLDHFEPYNRLLLSVCGCA